MRVDAILKFVRQRPFAPFRVFLTDQSSFEVRHPDGILVTPRRVVIGVGQTPEGVFRDEVWCDPLHITRIEPLAAA